MSNSSTVDIVQTLQEDYRKFPRDQTYSLYVEDVYFKDPMSEFRGRDRYQTMIGLINTLFLNCQMELHHIQRNGSHIRTDWTLSWNTPLPWKPRIHISGWSELTLTHQDLISAHLDYWHCSRLDVVKQHIPWLSS